MSTKDKIINFIKKEIVLSIAIIFAVIGPTSLVNTYAHIHTPVVISLIRSAYGILLGSIIGLIFIGAIKLLVKVIQKCQTQLK